MKKRIDLNRVCKDYGIELFDYETAKGSIEKLARLGYDTSTFDGFSVNVGRQVIFYDPQLSETGKRYTIAHELGHLLLGHLTHRHNTSLTKIPTYREIEANIFAAVLMVYDIICAYGEGGTV